jgi:hypothetical protein
MKMRSSPGEEMIRAEFEESVSSVLSPLDLVTCDFEGNSSRGEDLLP